MLFTGHDPHAERAALRQALDQGDLLRFCGAFSPLVAQLAARIGFDGVYVGSSNLAADLGLPDIGLVTLSEAVARGGAIARASALPTLIDVDTGYGEAVNVARAVAELEAAGLAAMHLEDQVNPKRCGHLENKALVAPEAMSEKIRAAVAARRDPNFLVVARTDARAVEGLAPAIERARAYRAAGADMIFPEALESEAEFRAFRDALDSPLMANMTEFGKSPLLDAETLRRLGYALVIYPATALRLAMRAMEEGLSELFAAGTQAGILERLQPRRALYDLVRYDDYGRFDRQVATYDDRGEPEH